MSNITKVLILLGIGLFLAAASIWFIGGKKKEYDVRATIKAQPYQLFPYLADPELKKKWMEGLIEETVRIPTVNEEEPTEPEIEGMIKEESELATVFIIDGEQVNFNGRVIRYAKDEVVAYKYRSEEMNRTAFFRLKGKGNETQLEYRRIVQLDGVKRFMSVFGDDNNRNVITEEIKRLTQLVESEVDNTIPDPNANRSTVGAESEDTESDKTDNSTGSQTNLTSEGSGGSTGESESPVEESAAGSDSSN